MTRILPETLDYTARDFDGVNERLQRSALSVFPNWSDPSIANFGNIIREMMAYVADVTDRYLAGQAVESKFITCTRRLNGVRHARALNYRLRQQTPSAAVVRLTLLGSYGSINVELGSVIRSQAATNPTRFRTVVAHTIPAAAGYYDLPVENSLAFEESFESTGLADQPYPLVQSPFMAVDKVEDAVTDLWEEVETFLDSGPTDSHYQVLLSDDDRAVMVFGDGNQGRIPSGTTTINYRTGGGAVVAGPNTLTVPEFTLTDAFSTQVSFSVTNALAATPGLPRETLAEAQERAPAELRVNERCVTWDDYQIVAQRVSGVGRAIILTSDQMTGINENFGYLYIAGIGSQLASGKYGPGTADASVHTAVKALIDGTYKPTITFAYDTVDAPQLAVDVACRIRILQGHTPATVAASIRSNLADYFAILNTDGTREGCIRFGFEMKDEDGSVRNLLPWSDLFGVILNTTGVKEVDDDSFRPLDDVTVPMNTIPVLGTVSITNDRTDEVL